MKTKRLAAAGRRAMMVARIMGKRTARQLLAAADAELVRQGKAAKARMRKRAVKAALKQVAKTVAIAGTAAAAVMAARAVRRRASVRPA